MKGKRKRGRQKKRWEDNIKEWKGMNFASSTRTAETGQDGKGLLRIHLWCSDELLGLWDLEPSYIMNTKIQMRQYIIFIKSQKFDSAEIKYFTI